MPDRTAFKRLLSFIKPHRFWFFLRIGATATKAASEVVLAYFCVLLVNAAVAGDRPGLITAIYLMLGVVVVGIVAYFLEPYASGRFSAYVARDIKERLSSHVGELPVSYMESHHSGDLILRLISEVTGFEAFLKGGFLDCVFHALRFAGCFAYMLILNSRLLLFCAAIMALAVLLSNTISRPLGRYHGQLQQNLAEANSVAMDAIGGFQILKAFSLQEIIYEKYKAAIDRSLSANLAMEKRQAMLSPVGAMLRMAPMVLTFLLGGYMVMIGRLSAGGLIAFIYMLNNLEESARCLVFYIGDYRSSLGAAARFFAVLDQDVERANGKRYGIDTAAPAVEFADVSFSYDGQAKVLDRLSFELRSRETKALVGQSGSGKTTVLKLLCGFYAEQGGCIKLYGKSLEEWNVSAARALISLVSQDTYLFPATIAENIAYGRPGASLDEITAAARAAHAHEFIMALPDGYDTLAGERGARLSGGQRQRISIARAILKNAPILLLDEPTSALDAESEMLVQEALGAFMHDRTVLVIAHRLSTVKNAHEVLVLDGGRIAESGPHDRLLARDGLYKRLYFKQFMSDSDSSPAMEKAGA